MQIQTCNICGKVKSNEDMCDKEYHCLDCHQEKMLKMKNEKTEENWKPTNPPSF
jgi:hypothetical protein